MAQGDLEIGLLLRIMGRLGELRDQHPNFVTTPNFLDLVRASIDRDSEEKMLWFIDRHLVFLHERGYVGISAKAVAGHRVVWLTAEGQMFVQPELAEFGREPLLPQVVKSIENCMQTLTYPEEEKAGMLYRLREALAKQAPDLIAKVLVEVSNKILTGGA